ncbi:MAG: alpha-glucan family phosphorylase [Actinomycetota bacterium]
MSPMNDGARDVARAVKLLSGRLPSSLAPLASLAYDYRWSWQPGGEDIFRAIDPHRWELSRGSPVRFLRSLPDEPLARAAASPIADRARARADSFDEPHAPERPVSFFCTEFAVHGSLPIYSGGLGVLAGDILKEASDRSLPYVGVGLLYRQGYFRQRVDPSGWQHEYWTDEDPDQLPAVLVTREDGSALTVDVPIRGRTVVTQVWRVNAGRVPLYLLDSERPENQALDRWITARLYVGDRRLRLAQYALLGIGGIRALRAMGFDPSIVHLNEGHACMAPLELMRESVRAGASFEAALEAARARTVFTTHTPIAAGNEAYTGAEVIDVVGALPGDLGVDEKDLLAIGRAHPESADEPFGLTIVGLRMARAANGVSRIHGRVAREMWTHIYPGFASDDVPIRHVTNGVHLPTWLSEPMRALLTRYLGDGWEERASDQGMWDKVEDIPAAELWAVRAQLRTRLVSYAREHAAADRLARGEPIEYAESAMRAFDPGVLTVSFARRAASYKRLYLLTLDPARALQLLAGDRSVQLLLARKPHPQDEEGKRIVQGVFELKWAPHVSERVAFLEDYQMAMAKMLTSGCDVWLNVPRPPLEASGTSGMKAALNGVLNCSVLDGWWDEAYDGTNGWAISSHPSHDHHAQDHADASALYDTLERHVVPMFYERDENGLPQAWIRRIKASLRTIGPRFCATRMLEDYAREMYRL